MKIDGAHNWARAELVKEGGEDWGAQLPQVVIIRIVIEECRRWDAENAKKKILVKFRALTPTGHASRTPK